MFNEVSKRLLGPLPCFIIWRDMNFVACVGCRCFHKVHAAVQVVHDALGGSSDGISFRYRWKSSHWISLLAAAQTSHSNKDRCNTRCWLCPAILRKLDRRCMSLSFWKTLEEKPIKSVQLYKLQLVNAPASILRTPNPRIPTIQTKNNILKTLSSAGVGPKPSVFFHCYSDGTTISSTAYLFANYGHWSTFTVNIYVGFPD